MLFVAIAAIKHLVAILSKEKPSSPFSLEIDKEVKNIKQLSSIFKNKQLEYYVEPRVVIVIEKSREEAVSLRVSIEYPSPHSYTHEKPILQKYPTRIR